MTLFSKICDDNVRLCWTHFRRYMNLALSDFTTANTARERDAPILTANHCSFTLKELLNLVKLKP